MGFSREKATTVEPMKPVAMALGASNILQKNIRHQTLEFHAKQIFFTSVAAQHNWIPKQLQPGGGKGWCF